MQNLGPLLIGRFTLIHLQSFIGLINGLFKLDQLIVQLQLSYFYMLSRCTTSQLSQIMRLILHPDDLPQFISSPVGLVDDLLELDQLIGEL